VRLEDYFREINAAASDTERGRSDERYGIRVARDEPAGDGDNPG
jgi:hypothetical protein